MRSDTQIRFEFDFRHEAAAMDAIGDSLRRQWLKEHGGGGRGRGRGRGRDSEHRHRGRKQKGGSEDDHSAAHDVEDADVDSIGGLVVPRSIPGLVTRCGCS